MVVVDSEGRAVERPKEGEKQRERERERIGCRMEARQRKEDATEEDGRGGDP